MNKYQDKWGRWHHKPCIDGNPSSNNGWIYTAYMTSRHGSIVVDWSLLRECYNTCLAEANREIHKDRDYILLRSPGKITPPISRDEILGIYALGFNPHIHRFGWNFSPYPIPKFSFIKLVKQLWEIKGKHRNYFWENNLDQIYRFAFSVPLQDRDFILRKVGKFNIFYWIIARIDFLIGGRSGIRWLKYGKGKDEMMDEFPEDHPIHSSTTLGG